MSRPYSLSGSRSLQLPRRNRYKRLLALWAAVVTFVLGLPATIVAVSAGAVSANPLPVPGHHTRGHALPGHVGFAPTMQTAGHSYPRLPKAPSKLEHASGRQANGRLIPMTTDSEGDSVVVVSNSVVVGSFNASDFQDEVPNHTNGGEYYENCDAPANTYGGTLVPICAQVDLSDPATSDVPDTNTQSIAIYDACDVLVAQTTTHGWHLIGTDYIISGPIGSLPVSLEASSGSCYGEWTATYSFSETFTDGQTLTDSASGTFEVTEAELLSLVGGGSGGDPDPSGPCGCGTPILEIQGIAPGTGDVVETSQDISVPGAGAPLELSRTYDSGLAQQEVLSATATEAPGYGWFYNLGMIVALNTSTNVATLTQENGDQITFSPYVSGSSPSWCTGSTNYCADQPRNLATLEENTGGTWTFVRYSGGKATTFDFSSSGQLVSETDEAGDSIAATSEAAGSGACPSSASTCTLWTSSASGRALTLAFDSSGRLTSANDGSADTVSYCYFGQSCASGASGGGADDLYLATVPGQGTTSYGYDSSNSTAAFDHDLLTEVLPSGGTVTNTYNTSGQVASQDAPSADVTLTYSGNNQSVSGGDTSVSTWPTGTSGALPAQVVDYQFSSGYLVAETTDPGTSSEAATYYNVDLTSTATTMVQDGNDNVDLSTLAEDSSSDPMNAADVTLSSDGMGNETEYAYNADNQVWCEVGPAEYLDAVRCPAATTIASASSGASLPQSTINVSSAAAFSSSSPLAVLSASGVQAVTCTGATSTSFTGCSGGSGALATGDPVVQATASPGPGSDPWPGVTVTFYNTSGLTVQTTDPLGNTTTYSYTSGVSGVPNGLEYCSVDPVDYGNGVTCPSYGASHVSGTATTTYDSAGDVLSQTNADGGTNSFAYADSAFAYLPTTLTSTAGTVTNDTYNSAGQLTKSVAGFGSYSATTVTAYDPAGRAYCTIAPLAYSQGYTTCPTVTTIAAGSSGATLPQSTIDVASTSGFSTSSPLAVPSTAGLQPVTCTGDTSTTFTGCSGGTGTLSAGDSLLQAVSAPTRGADPWPGDSITVYDAADQPIYTVSPIGGVTQTVYDEAGNAFCTMGPTAYALGTSYTCPATPPSSPPTTSSDSYPGATIDTYDSTGRVVQVTNPLGGITLNAYDGDSNVLTATAETTSATSSSAPNVVTSYSYDADNQTTATTVDQSGGSAASTTEQSYDPDGNVYCSVSANAVAMGATAYQCPAWQASWIAGPPSPLTLYSTTPSSAQANNVTTTFYDADGDEVQSTDPNVHTTISALDGDGRTYCSTDAADFATWLAAHTSGTYPYLCPSSPPTTAPTTGSNPGYVTTIFDYAGNTLSSTDQAGDTTSYTYSPGGQVLTTTNPNGSVTTNCYYYEDSSGECAHSAPAGGGSAEDLYSTTTPDTNADPSGEVTSYTYYPGGQTDTTTTPAGVTTDAYDANGDLHTATYSSTSTGYSEPTNDTYDYNTDGTLYTMADETGTTTYGYDANADVASVTNGAGLELSYSYYPVGDLGSVTYPNSDSVTYAYNALGEESSLTDWLSNTTSFGYDPDGLLKTATLPNGITETTDYDNADQVSSITDTDGSTTLASFGYDRDPNNNVTSESDTGTPGPSSQSYGYDPAMRVTADGSSSYNYDAASDLTTGPGGAARSFDDAGQLCWSMASPPGGSTCSSDPSGSTTYSYDTAGDRTATTAPSSTSSYAWDQNLKLSSATTPSATVGYSYDGSGELADAHDRRQHCRHGLRPR